MNSSVAGCYLLLKVFILMYKALESNKVNIRKGLHGIRWRPWSWGITENKADSSAYTEVNIAMAANIT